VTQALTPRRHLDGRHDFDFLFGLWHVANRKLADPFSERTEWLQFDALAEARPILAGLGNYDTYSADNFPGRGRFEGFALRLFDDHARVWRIWWASTVGGGQLDRPVVGSFQDGVGRFECDDTIAGRDVRVRFDWRHIQPDAARWEQSFSFDDGATFVLNWVMELGRIA
jgi:hypothetical protein